MGNKKIFNIFAFFLAFPLISILGNNITFYLFAYLFINSRSFIGQLNYGRTYYYSLLIIVIIATLAAPYSEMIRHPGLFGNILLVIQYFYWIIMAVYLISFRKELDLLNMSKWIFYGTICSIIGFYIIRQNLFLGVAELTFRTGRNPFIFSLLSTIPISFYYIAKTKSKRFMVLAAIFFLVIILLSNGRSGAIIVTLELFLIAGIVRPSLRRLAIIVTVPIALLAVSLSNEKTEALLAVVATNIEPLSPRVASLLIGEGDGDLDMDKSWLIRKLMQDKGIEIFYKHPFTGVGPGNFNYYDAELRNFLEYDRLFGNSESFYNTLSAHNSYVQVLGETGIFGIICVLCIIGIPVLNFIRRFLTSRVTLEDLPLIALLGISIHFYAISALTGALSWFIFGLAWATMYRR